MWALPSSTVLTIMLLFGSALALMNLCVKGLDHEKSYWAAAEALRVGYSGQSSGHSGVALEETGVSSILPS